MKRRFFACFMIVFLAGIFSDCSNKKNTLITRTFHNITSHYNGFYWATESIKDGVFKIEQGYKEDYTKMLPMFIYPDNASSKTIYPEMDRAIKKSSTVIQRHAIIDKKTKREVYGAVRWIDDNWIVIGEAHFYKREFFSGIEIFDFVAKSYKSKQKYEAYLWLIRTYNEIGTLSQSETIISKLKTDKNLPKEFKRDLHALISEFYIKQGLYDEAAKELEKTIELTRNRKKKARYSFILAQIFEAKKDNKAAVKHYNKVIAMKPNYEMLFNAKIKRARLYDVKEEKSKGIKQELQKMAKDPKNEEYLDVIYYTLGEMEEKEKAIDLAMTYYKKSARSSVNNDNQKAQSYLKLADHSFDKTFYVDAEAYYDSTVSVLDKKHPEYEFIVNKQKNLNELIKNLKIIHYEDSVQTLVRMDSSKRNAVIQKAIKKVKDDEEKQKEAIELQKIADKNALLNNNNNPIMPTSTDNSWYFYNSAIKTFGANEFAKKFGNRKLEDNWRRSNKQTSLDPLAIDGGKKDDDTSGGKTAVTKANDKLKPDYYLKDLPFGDSALKASDEKILEAFYQLGSIYREALNNHEKSMAAFDEMARRFPKNTHEANSWYQEYRMCTQDKNAKAEHYKNLLKQNYPNSDYMRIIDDPDYGAKALASKSELEQFYTETFDLYEANKFRDAYSKCNEGLDKFGGKSDYSPKFALLRAMCIGRLSGMDSMELALISVIAKFGGANVQVKDKAQELLDYIKVKKGGTITNTVVQPDLFTVNDKSEHFWVCLLPKDFKGENNFKAKLSDYDSEFFSSSNLAVDAMLFGDQPLIYVKTLKDKESAMKYYDAVYTNESPFALSSLNKAKCILFVISKENFQKMVQQKKLDDYYQFFIKNYQAGVNK